MSMVVNTAKAIGSGIKKYVNNSLNSFTGFLSSALGFGGGWSAGVLSGKGGGRGF